MTLQQQVTSLEISQKLKELGLKQESVYIWCLDRNGADEFDTRLMQNTKNNRITTLDHVSAFTVAELGEMLPSNIHQFEKDDSDPTGKWFSSAKTDDNTWVAGYGENSTNEVEFEADTEADARGKMLIYLLENNLLPEG